MDRRGKTKFERAVCLKIANFRKGKNLSQYEFSLRLGVSRSFVAQTESPNNPSTYNINHINRLAHEFNCDFETFLPDKPIPEDEWD